MVRWTHRASVRLHVPFSDPTELTTGRLSAAAINPEIRGSFLSPVETVAGRLPRPREQIRDMRMEALLDTDRGTTQNTAAYMPSPSRVGNLWMV